MKKLYKSTIIIWSEFDPESVELSDLANDAMSGGSLCSSMKAELIEDPLSDPDFNGEEFFNIV